MYNYHVHSALKALERVKPLHGCRHCAHTCDQHTQPARNICPVEGGDRWLEPRSPGIGFAVDFYPLPTTLWSQSLPLLSDRVAYPFNYCLLAAFIEEFRLWRTYTVLGHNQWSNLHAKGWECNSMTAHQFTVKRKLSFHLSFRWVNILHAWTANSVNRLQQSHYHPSLTFSHPHHKEVVWH